MTTIADLHLKAGNPDFSHWRTKKVYTLIQAAFLSSSIDPLILGNTSYSRAITYLEVNKPTNWQHAYLMIEGLIEAVCTHEIKSPCIYVHRSADDDPYCVEQINVSYQDINFILPEETRITREELHKWLKKYGYFGQAHSQPQQTGKNAEPLQTHQPKLITTNYTTPALECLEAVIREFWLHFDPNGDQPPPKQETVIQWIKENHPDIEAEQIRKAIDKICRHPKAKAGGIKPLRKTKDITPLN